MFHQTIPPWFENTALRLFFCLCVFYFLPCKHSHVHMCTWGPCHIITQVKWMSACSEIRLSLLCAGLSPQKRKRLSGLLPKLFFFSFFLEEANFGTFAVMFDTHWQSIKSTVTYKQFYTLLKWQCRAGVSDEILKVTYPLNLASEGSLFYQKVSCLAAVLKVTDWIPVSQSFWLPHIFGTTCSEIHWYLW